MDDPGIFGPGTVTWRVHSDPVLWVGGIRALFLQALHPEAMAGVARHSGFRTDPWGRLFRTAQYIGAVSYGTTADARTAAARVRGLHRRLGINDPRLLLWVHCCEVDSFLTVARGGGMRLPNAEADRYVAEQVRAAELVGIPTDLAPTTTAELRERIGGYRPELTVSREALDAARFVLFPPLPPRARPARPLWAGVATLAFCLQPRWARRMYRMPGLPTTDVGAALTLRALRTGLFVLPARMREGPSYRAAKERLGVSA